MRYRVIWYRDISIVYSTYIWSYYQFVVLGPIHPYSLELLHFRLIAMYSASEVTLMEKEKTGFCQATAHQYVTLHIAKWCRWQCVLIIMMTPSNGNIFRVMALRAVTGEFPPQRPVTRNFDVFFDLRLNKRLNKQSWGCWFETPSCSLWRHCNDDRNIQPSTWVLFEKTSVLITVDGCYMWERLCYLFRIVMSLLTFVGYTMDSRYIAVPYNTIPHTVH